MQYSFTAKAKQLLLFLAILVGTAVPAAAQEAPAPGFARPIKLLVFGDSLTSGYGVPDQYGFPSVLARRLRADGYGNVLVYNGSVPGDTSADGYQRLGAALEEHPDVVLVEFGGNDMLDKVDPRVTYQNLAWIVMRCRAQGAKVILAGMLSLPKNGPNYVIGFDTMFPALARAYHLPFYPFFLAGVWPNPALMQSDLEHPNAAGVQVIVARTAPLIEKTLRSLEPKVARASAR